jgi:hypothetical protein
MTEVFQLPFYVGNGKSCCAISFSSSLPLSQQPCKVDKQPMYISVLYDMFSYQIFIRSGGFHRPGMLSLWPITRTETNGLPPIR